jgi:hypothetical protein
MVLSLNLSGSLTLVTVEDPVPEPTHHAAGNLRHPPPRGVGGGHGQPPLTIQHHHHRYRTTQCYLDGWNSFIIKKNFRIKMSKIKFGECDKAKWPTCRVLKVCARMFSCCPPSEQKLLIIYICMLKELNSAADPVFSLIWIYSSPGYRILDPGLN